MVLHDRGTVNVTYCHTNQALAETGFSGLVQPLGSATGVGPGFSYSNAGLEGFVRAAALELPRGLRINAVTGWVREALVAMKMDPEPGMPAAEVAQTYLRAVEGDATGQILDTVASPA